MFRWYQGADICFVFLSDLDQPPDLSWCRWFTRGWTLQEMLAPASIEFYNQTWTCIGTKETLLPQLSAITGIREAVLTGAVPLADMAVAEKMSWAAHRATTRSEDLAYCLFGLFDVNMPLIYGEGNNSFRRLQEDIIRRSNDSTIFAWEPSADSPWNHGLFAASPRDFAVYRDKCPNLTRMESLDLGLRGGRGESYLLKLGSVSTSPQPYDTILAITLLKIGAGLFLRRDRSLEAIAHENGVPLHLGTTVIDPHVITIVLSDNYSTTLTMIRNLERSVKISLEGPDAFFCPPSTSHISMALVRSSLHVTLLVIIDRRGGILPLLVDWDANWRAWNACLFQERHVRELPTWYDLGYHVGESIESLSNSVTLEPPPDDPDRSPIKATATLQQRDISRHDLQDLSSWTQLPPGLAPRYQLVIETTRENGNDKTLEEVAEYG